MADNSHSFSAYNKAVAITGVSLATVIILIRLVSSQKENHHQIYRKIPRPQGCYPYVGHLFSLTDDPHRQIAKWHQKFNSPIVNIKMGVQNWISISSAKLAHKIYTNHGAVTSARPHNIFGVHYRNNFGGKGLSFTNGKKWTEARSIGDVVLASIDSGVSAMSWVVAILCWYPKVQENIYKEISEYKKLKSSLPSFGDRHHLPYLNSVLSECLRWKPTNAAGFPHETAADIVVDDYYIPAKTIIILSMEAMHSDESIFKNAKEFVPDRFINNTKPIYAMVHGKFEERDQYNFGFGRRDCPGTALAEMEMFRATVAIVDRCIIKPDVDSNGKDIYPVIDERIDTGVALDPLPYKIRLVKRRI